MIDVLGLLETASWWSTIDKIGVVLVILGVIGEGISEFLPERLTRCINTRRLGRISWLILVAGLFIEFAAESQRDADDGLVIAALNAQAAPRRLTPEQENALASVFAKFPGEKVHVSSYMRDPEGSMLGVSWPPKTGQVAKRESGP